MIELSVSGIDQPVRSKTVTVARYDTEEIGHPRLERQLLELETEDGWIYEYHRFSPSEPWVLDRGIRPDGSESGANIEPSNCEAVRRALEDVDEPGEPEPEDVGKAVATDGGQSEGGDADILPEVAPIVKVSPPDDRPVLGGNSKVIDP